MFTKPDEEAPAQKEQAKGGATDWQPREKQTPVQMNQTKEELDAIKASQPKLYDDRPSKKRRIRKAGQG